MQKHVAIYARVSTKKQDTRSQEADLKQWIEAFADGMPVKWYRDKFTGKTMDRPGWNRLENATKAGKVAKIVIWRLDRLGRTAAGLATLFETLQERKVGLESLKDKIDLETAAGRLLAHVLASVAAYENEVRSERVHAGQAAAREAGKTWGGRKQGTRIKVTDDAEKIVRQMHAAGETKTAMSRATGLSRPTIYRLLEQQVG